MSETLKLGIGLQQRCFELEEKLKACEAERELLEINFLSETKAALKLEAELKAIEKIAREGFMEIYEKCKTLPECENIAELSICELNKLMNDHSNQVEGEGE